MGLEQIWSNLRWSRWEECSYQTTREEQPSGKGSACFKGFKISSDSTWMSKCNLQLRWAECPSSRGVERGERGWIFHTWTCSTRLNLNWNCIPCLVVFISNKYCSFPFLSGLQERKCFRSTWRQEAVQQLQVLWEQNIRQLPAGMVEPPLKDARWLAEQGIKCCTGVMESIEISYHPSPLLTLCRIISRTIVAGSDKLLLQCLNLNLNAAGLSHTTRVDALHEQTERRLEILGLTIISQIYFLCVAHRCTDCTTEEHLFAQADNSG